MLLLGCLLLSGVVSLLVGKDTNWDLQNYHLYNPYAFLEDRVTQDIAPAQRQSYHNPLADLPFYGLFLTLNEHPALFTLIMGLPYGLSLFLLLLIAREVLHPDLRRRQQLTLITTMVVLGSTGAATVGVIGSTMNEIPMSLLQLLATLLVLLVVNGRCQLPQGRDLGLLLLAGFVAGISAGLKLTYGIYSMAIGTGIFALFLARRVSVWGVVTAAVGVFIGFGIVSVPWMLTLWETYGNPTLPFFNDFFQSPWAPAERFSDLRFLPKSPEQALLFPFHWVMGSPPVAGEVLFRDWRMATLWLAAAFLAAAQTARWIAARFRHRWASVTGNSIAGGAANDNCVLGEIVFRGDNLLFLAVTFAAAYLLWLKGFGIYRYTVFLEFLSGPLIIAALHRFTRPGPERIGILAMATVLILATTKHQAWGRASVGERFVDVSAPAVRPYSLVFLVGGEPQAYVIPFMEPTARYIGINNNYLKMDQENYSLNHIRRLIAKHKGAMYALVPPRSDGTVPTLTGIGLRISPTGCKEITSNGKGYRPLQLCPVGRIPPVS